jgi:hypothetical protein
VPQCAVDFRLPMPACERRQRESGNECPVNKNQIQGNAALTHVDMNWDRRVSADGRHFRGPKHANVPKEHCRPATRTRSAVIGSIADIALYCMVLMPAVRSSDSRRPLRK